MHTRSLLGALALVAASASGAAAQATPPMTLARTEPGRTSLGLDVLVAQPLAEFRDNVSAAYGAGGHALFRLDEAGVLGLRLDAGFLNYGNEHKRVAISPTIGGRITLDLNTSNNIFLLGVGPQLMAPTGSVRPYVNGTAGVAYFSTQSSLKGSSSGETFAQTTNQDDAVFAYGGGGGIQFDLPVAQRAVAIDLGARYLDTGNARYLKEGSIQDNNDGTISFTPLESKARMVTYHLGVSYRIPRRVAR